MRLAISIFFLVLFGLTVSGPLVPIAHYYVNTEYYKAKCRNTEKPELQCHGQCRLQENLQALVTNHANTDLPPAKIPTPEIDPFQLNDYVFSFRPNGSDISKVKNPFIPVTSRGYYTNVFHPPSCLLMI